MSISYALQSSINGLGLLGQPIHKIQEDDIKLDKIEKSYNQYTDGRITANVATLRGEISSNVSTINGSITANAASANSVINTQISANVATLRGEISGNVSTLNGSITSNAIGKSLTVTSPNEQILNNSPKI